jgi:hypothetical protein
MKPLIDSLSESPLSRSATAPPKGERLAAAAAAAMALALAGCAPKPHAPAAVQLDCRTPFAALRTKIITQPNLVPAPAEPGEPYRVYSTADGQASYFVTEPGAPAHPAIVMQQVGPGGTMKNSGCAYGDKAAYGELMAYVAGLKAGRS